MDRINGKSDDRCRVVAASVGLGTALLMDVVTFSTAQGAALYSKTGRLVAFVNPANKPIVTWDPPDGGHGFRFPLEIGKTWNETASMTMPDGKVRPHENACSVESREDITVPAGTFMTFKVHCTSPRGLELTQWYAPGVGLVVKQIQKRAANNPFGGAGTRDEHLVSLDLKQAGAARYASLASCECNVRADRMQPAPLWTGQQGLDGGREDRGQHRTASARRGPYLRKHRRERLSDSDRGAEVVR